ncbi:MAG: sialic acid TRAP transporter substrate-binding protein SiaP [Spirochaetales bacterium]|jgi:tripartite ATP-independent transporter DctP family solute receptor|nr:sialic acid TRAP transporter substrate-binding protein SiaP [Spirochaetales bacterium]
MKKILGLVLALTFFASFVYAGGGSEAGGSKKEEATLKLAHIYAPTHAFSIGMKNIAAAAKEKSGGKLIINEFPAAQLGSETDIANGGVNGSIEMILVGCGEIGKRYTPLLIMDGPFLFSGYEHARKVLDGPIGQELWDGCLKATGLRHLRANYYGSRNVTTKKAINSPDDLRGMKIRAPEQPMNVAIVRAMGAQPTPMALSEVYLALQQNVVDGQENPIPTIHSQKFYEVQTHISLTKHMTQFPTLFIRDALYQDFTPELKKALDDAVKEVGPSIDKAVLDDEENLLSDMKSKGMTVIQPNIDAFVKATAGVYKEFEKNWGPDLYGKIQAIR